MRQLHRTSHLSRLFCFSKIPWRMLFHAEERETLEVFVQSQRRISRSKSQPSAQHGIELQHTADCSSTKITIARGVVYHARPLHRFSRQYYLQRGIKFPARTPSVRAVSFRRSENVARSDWFVRFAGELTIDSRRRNRCSFYSRSFAPIRDTRANDWETRDDIIVSSVLTGKTLRDKENNGWPYVTPDSCTNWEDFDSKDNSICCLHNNWFFVLLNDACYRILIIFIDELHWSYNVPVCATSCLIYFISSSRETTNKHRANAICLLLTIDVVLLLRLVYWRIIDVKRRRSPTLSEEKRKSLGAGVFLEQSRPAKFAIWRLIDARGLSRWYCSLPSW